MLETIREYGLECLTASGESELTRRAHAGYYLRLAEEANAEANAKQEEEAASSQSPTEPEGWFDRLVRDHDNLRAALSWLHEQGETELLVRLANVLLDFWFIGGQWREGCLWLERALAGTAGARTTARAEALYGLRNLTFNLGDVDRAEELCRENLALARELGEIELIGICLGDLGHNAMFLRGDYAAAHALYEESLALTTQPGMRWLRSAVFKYLARVVAYQGDYVRARVLAEEALVLAREIGARFFVANTLLCLGEVTFFQGDLAHAQALAEESLARLRELGDRHKDKFAEALSWLGQIVFQQGDLAHAQTLAEESLQLFRELGDWIGTILALSLLGKVTCAQGDYVAARTCFEQSLQAARQRGAKWEIASGLEGLASWVAAQGEHAWAARLCGVAAALRAAMGVPLPPVYRAGYERAVAAARTHLGEQAFASAWAEGRTMSVEHVLIAPAATPVPTLTALAPASAPLGRKAVPSYPAAKIWPKIPAVELVSRKIWMGLLASKGRKPR